ncbi:MAG: glycosyltransferase family 39 protein [Candidatus Omnitrophota bacterium]
MPFKKITLAALVLLLVLFHLINNIVWLSVDGKKNIGCEVVFHLERAFEIYGQINPANSTYPQKLSNLTKYPWFDELNKPVLGKISSVFAAFSVFFATLFNLSFFRIEYVNIISLAILILTTYLIAKTIGGKKIGIIAAFLIAFYPMTYGIFRKLTPVAMLLPAITLSYYCLLKTNYFRRTLFSVLLGACAFFSIIIQPLYIVFFIPIFIYAFLIIIKNRHNLLLNRLANLSLCALIMLSSFLFTYPNFNALTQDYQKIRAEIFNNLTTRNGTFIGNADNARTELFIFAAPDDSCPCTQIAERGINLKTLFFYPLRFVDSTGLPLALIFLISLFLFFKNKGCKNKLLLLLWIVIPYIILTLFERKWGRFYAPALPAAAIITAAGIETIKHLNVKKIIYLLICFVCIIQFFICSYSLNPEKRPLLCSVFEGINSSKPMPTNHKQVAFDIMQLIGNKKNANKPVKVDVFDIILSATRFSTNWYNDLTSYFCLLLKIFKNPNTSINLHWNISKAIVQKADNDFLVILKDKDYSLDADLLSNYHLIQQHTLLPENVSALIYKNKF